MEFQFYFFSELKKKRWIVIIFIILVGLLVGVEKTFFSHQIIQSTTFHSERTVQVKYSDPALKQNQDFNYKVFFSTYSEMDQFLRQTESIYDYSKFDANWNRYDLEDKLKWMQKHISIINVNNGVVQYVFVLKPEDPKDDEDVKEYGEQFLDDYIQFSQNRMREVLPVDQIENVDEITILPYQKEQSNQKSFFKFALAGGFLGALMGVVIIAISAMGKYKR